MDTKLITLFSAKTNIGKSTLALSLCKDLDYKYTTNDKINSKFNLELLDSIDLDIGEIAKNNCILDCGGYLDNNLITYLKASDLIIYLTELTDMSFLSLEEVIPDLKKMNEDIVLVVNKIEDTLDRNGNIKFAKNEIVEVPDEGHIENKWVTKQNKELIRFYNKYIDLGFKKKNILLMRKTTIFHRTFTENKSILKVRMGSGIFNIFKTDGIRNDYKRLLKYIKDI